MSKEPQSHQTTIALANMVSQVGCITSLASIVIIGLAFGVGYLLDNLFGTDPLFTFIALLGSFPVTLYAIVQLSLRAVARAQRLQEQAERQQEREKELKNEDNQ